MSEHSAHWVMQWLSVSRQQAIITWANVDKDLCRHLASLGHHELTHRTLNKMAFILQMTSSNAFSWTKNVFRFELKFVPLGPIDVELIMIWLMAWQQTVEKPFSNEPMVTQFTGAYICHQVSMG